jgi:hypothetical protein
MKKQLSVLLLSFLFVSCVLFAEETTLIKVKPRELAFGGLHWRTKSSITPTSPGPNYFNADPSAIWVDDWGLHLTLEQHGEKWWATEIYTRERVGYGTYTFTVETNAAAFDPHVVAGFFTWDTAPDEYNREIDIEFGGRQTGPSFSMSSSLIRILKELRCLILNSTGISLLIVLSGPHRMSLSLPIMGQSILMIPRVRIC